MGGFNILSAVANNIVDLLRAGFAERTPFEPARAMNVALVHTEDFERGAGSLIQLPALSVFVYRVDVNRTMRAAWSGVGVHDSRAHTPLDMHMILTAWADNADHELAILGRTVQILEAHPTLVGPLLSRAAPAAAGQPGASAQETVQLIFEEVPAETIMRVFDLVPTKFRLSLPYLARVLRLDGLEEPAPPPVTRAITGIVPSVTG